ncbi:Kinesin-like protein KIN12B [Apostasia shenzhenica]|uniref:Kinesin-like protein KIN12B n=1 Tax=Apostasia shenzhenica TaxID=1088818 RepID=A0A2I0APJ8_9ASPA|nr:Kinesin-like protein KIN12B [Apostasia shenzhenica]
MKALLHARSGRVPPSEALTPSSQKQRPPRFPKENVDPNAMAPDSPHFRSPTVSGKSPAVRSRSPLPPRPPPSSNPLKRKLNLETLQESGSPANFCYDSGVQVIVRMRPLNKEEEEEGFQIAQKISSNSISILDQTFTFDSVADASSTQQDIFQLLGLPLVENCLAGLNSSIFAYGQTGSGKTYTMWGPPSSLTTDGSLVQERGLTPRVFELLFSRINEEQAKNSDKHLSFQCRCSFLEIYNEQITDLLCPSQGNLQIREDVRTGVFVDFLTEEHVFELKDVIQLLIKSTVDGLSSLKTSRINLVDLAGSERQKATRTVGRRLKEAGNINRSLSQLGNLINILAEVSQSGKQRHIPYRDSRLTFLLQDSLGGNSKLAMICTISPLQSCKNETLSTLRFAQRAKAIKNKAVINETTEDDVNVLREQIRQLKDELLRMKSNNLSSDGSKSSGWNVHRSLSLLRKSLCHPRTLPVVEDDSDEEMEIVEEGVEKDGVGAHPTFNEQDISNVVEESGSLLILKELNPCYADKDAKPSDIFPMQTEDSNRNKRDTACSIHIEEGNEIDQITPKFGEPEVQGRELTEAADGRTSIIPDVKVHISQDECKQKLILSKRKSLDCNPEMIMEGSAQVKFSEQSHDSSRYSYVSPGELNIVGCEPSLTLQSPTLSISPRLENCSRKSLRTSLSTSASQKNISAPVEHDPGNVNISLSDNLKLSNSDYPATKSSFKTTENLETSLCQGLQIIDNHQSGSLRDSLFRFSLKRVDPKFLISINKVDVGVQTLPEESCVSEDSSLFVCSHCNEEARPLEINDSTKDAGLQMVAIDDCQVEMQSQSAKQYKKTLPKAVKKVLAGTIRREMDLENHCIKQAGEIMHLNRLVQQYKHERECLAVIEQTREDKISRLESLMDGILPTEQFMAEEFLFLKNEHMMLKEKFENHPEVLRLNIELKRVQNELDGYRNFFDLGEREVLMEEIQDLRGQLLYCIDSSHYPTYKRVPMLQLTHLTELGSTPAMIGETKEEIAREHLEQERQYWTEAETKWISQSEELKAELEANRAIAEKWKTELESEKKCSEELKEALQTALLVHTRTLEQYADLEVKHMALLCRHRKMREGITDVKRAAARAGVKGAEFKLIESLAAQIEVLKADREKDKRYWRDENKGLQSQLKDTVEAVEAAGELLGRLKEAEKAATAAQEQALAAEQRAEKFCREIDDLKKHYEKEIARLNQLLAESRPLIEQGNEYSADTGPYPWFYGYDKCNI